MSSDPQVLVELRAIRASIDGAISLLQRLAGQPDHGRGADGQRLKPADRRALEVLLPAVHGAFRGDGWLVRDLFASADTTLQAALQTARLDAHRLGRLFRRVAGQCVNDFRIERIGDTRDGALLNVTMMR